MTPKQSRRKLERERTLPDEQVDSRDHGYRAPYRMASPDRLLEERPRLLAEFDRGTPFEICGDFLAANMELCLRRAQQRCVVGVERQHAGRVAGVEFQHPLGDEGAALYSHGRP